MTAIDLSGNEEIEVLGAFGFSAIRAKMLRATQARPTTSRDARVVMPTSRGARVVAPSAQKCVCPRARRARRTRRSRVLRRSMYNMRRRMPW